METRKNRRFQAWLTLVLMLAVLGEGLHMAQRHLHVRKDFSEDRLFEVSAGTKAILGRIEDRLQVKAFITGDVQSGEWALVKARVEAQVKDFQRLADGSMGLSTQDPSVLSSAAEEAQSYGIDPLPVVTGRGGDQTRQLVYLGLVLRYKSRTEVLPLLNPWTLEVDFAGAVQRLLRDRPLRWGWMGESLEGDAERVVLGQFQGLRSHLGKRMELVEIPVANLEAGESIPNTVDGVLVLRPQDWHPRAAFALDQYIQRGGRALICLDTVHSNSLGPAAHIIEGRELQGAGLEPMLAHWGAPLLDGHIWDRSWPGQRHFVVSDLGPDGKPTEAKRLEPITDPGCPKLQPGAFERTFPPTGRSGTLDLWWCQAFGPGQVPDGMERLDIVHSSEESYLVDWIQEAGRNAGEIESYTRSLAAGGSGQSYVLATTLTGRFTSPFRAGAPAAFDATQHERGKPVEKTSEPVVEGQADSRVVLVGDADWLRDPLPGNYAPVMAGATADNLRLLDNIMDWLSRSDDLIDVRSKEPRQRPIRNMLEQELRAAGIYGLEAPRTPEEMRERLKRADLAEGRVRRQRWSSMLWPLLLAMAGVLGIGAAWNWKERKSR
ncbi:MAG: Gldg family protein [Planctomycetota bacterium]|nr:Gldg family protein [Planctomycetota bacterium]